MGLMAPEGTDQWEAYLSFYQRRYTFDREQTPEDVASAIMFLMSEESGNITDYTVYVDGIHRSAMC